MVRDAVEATPDDRDRYVDLLRAFSICVVVLGHWLIAVVEYRGGEFTGDNALARIPGLWALTWVLQVMPLFFFVGGFANLASWDSVRDKGGTYWHFLHSRLERLLRPVVLFVAIALPLMTLLDLTDLDEGAVALVGGTTARVLWFLGLYLVVVALAPITADLHRKHGVRVPIALTVAVVVVDVSRLHFDVPYIGYLNFLAVWLFVHQLGYFYKDGTLVGLGRVGALRLAGVGLIALAALTLSGLYPGSMVGLPGQRSNMDPPSICIVALTLWQVGLAMLLRPWMNEKLKQPDLWARVIVVNVTIMTIFLWHLAVLVVANAVALPLGLPQPDVGTWGWWALRLLWLPVLAGSLALVVTALGKYEHPRHRRGPPTDHLVLRRDATTTALFLALLGVLGFAVTGFHDAFSENAPDLIVFGIDPFASFVYLMLGAWLVRAAALNIDALRHSMRAIGVALALVLGGFALSRSRDFNPLALNAFTAGAIALLLASLVWIGRRSEH
jgi:fucose 4-O-acetylase-like acetyltransferase